MPFENADAAVEQATAIESPRRGAELFFQGNAGRFSNVAPYIHEEICNASV
jgi:hypothetical protein